LKKYFWDYFFLIGIAAIIVAFDQWTKYLVRTQIPLGGSWSPWAWLAPYARIVHWQNTGAAFGMFQGFNLVFSILAIVVSIGILYYFPRVPRNEWLMRVTMTMMLGGALGNLVDRLTLGTVTDFVSLGTFAVFNVADASISVGTAIMILAVWLSERKQKKLAESVESQRLDSSNTPDDMNKVEQTIDSEKHPLE
jgi:signal peptidase II